MGEVKDQIIALIQYKAEQDLADLSIEFARAPSEEKEEILAAMEFERFISECCALSLEED
ncbi:hypothetical protein ACFL6U_30385 [Planctomycetota bacterium]